MITFKHGDVLESGANLICHQVNCQGKMNSGIAKQIRTRFPEVFKTYRIWYDTNELKLGRVVFAAVINESDMFYIANMCSQDKYGYDKKQYTDYTAFRQCLQQIRDMARSFSFDFKIALPYGIGCGLGGGDWETIYKIIDEELEECNVELWKL